MRLTVETSDYHDFDERLAYSLKGEDEPFWDAFYREAFPNLISHEICKDLEEQRRGVDRRLYLPHGRVLRIDEKKREKVYPDILLEFASVYRNGRIEKPGWIEKEQSIDYLAVAFMPTWTVHLFPWDLLKRAWDWNKDHWLSLGRDETHGFRIVPAQNQGYETLSVAVPTPLLTAALNDAMVIPVS